MNNKKVENINNDLNKFVALIKDKYNIKLNLNVNDIIKEDFENKKRVTLKELHEIVIITAKKYDPDIIKYLDFSTRRKPVINYAHCFAFIADKLGYKKVEIADYMDKNHATVINSIVRARDLIQTGDSEITTTYNSILNSYRYYVGNVSKDVKEEVNT